MVTVDMNKYWIRTFKKPLFYRNVFWAWLESLVLQVLCSIGRFETMLILGCLKNNFHNFRHLQMAISFVNPALEACRYLVRHFVCFLVFRIVTPRTFTTYAPSTCHKGHTSRNFPALSLIPGSPIGLRSFSRTAGTSGVRKDLILRGDPILNCTRADEKREGSHETSEVGD